MSIMGDGHYLTGDAPLCGECSYKLGGEDFAFREPSGVWIHHDCGLRMGSDEMERRGLMLEQVSEGEGYLNTNPDGQDNAASFGHRLAAEADHSFMRERIDGKRSVAGVAAEFNATRNAVHQQLAKEQQVLSEVNQWRAAHGLELVSDWSTWKRMGKNVQAPLPAPKQRGGCLKTLLIVVLAIVALFILGPLALTVLESVVGGW